jgi:hypothetical protein
MKSTVPSRERLAGPVISEVKLMKIQKYLCLVAAMFSVLCFIPVVREFVVDVIDNPGGDTPMVGSAMLFLLGPLSLLFGLVGVSLIAVIVGKQGFRASVRSWQVIIAAIALLPGAVCFGLIALLMAI